MQAVFLKEVAVVNQQRFDQAVEKSLVDFKLERMRDSFLRMATLEMLFDLMMRFRVVEAVSALGTDFAPTLQAMLAMEVPVDELRSNVKQAVESEFANAGVVYHKIFDNFQADAVTSGKKVSCYSEPKNGVAFDKLQEVMKIIREERRFHSLKKNNRDVSADSQITPRNVMREISRKLKVPRHKLWDLCKLCTNWSYKDSFDALSDPIPEDVVLYCNPPYSRGAAFIRLCAELFALGHNVVLLTPTCSQGTDFAVSTLTQYGTIESAPEATFTLASAVGLSKHEQPIMMTLSLSAT